MLPKCIDLYIIAMLFWATFPISICRKVCCMCIIMSKGVHLLIMGTFNRFLVLNQFCMDKIKY